MALELRYPRSKWWYGRVAIGERRLLKNLGVKIGGEVPAKLTQFGDPVFERTRAKAQAALEKLQLEPLSIPSLIAHTCRQLRTYEGAGAIALDGSHPQKGHLVPPVANTKDQTGFPVAPLVRLPTWRVTALGWASFRHSFPLKLGNF